MSVDPNCSSGTFQLVSVKTEIVPSCFLLSSAKQEHCEIWHSVNPRKPELFLSKVSLNWRKRKYCSLHLSRPRAEQLSEADSKVLSSAFVMEWHLLPRNPSQQGKFLHNDPRCDSITSPAAPIVLQGHGHPNPPGQLCQPRSLTPRSLWPAAKMQLYLNYPWAGR